MEGLENLSQEMAIDLIALVNSLKKLPKNAKVKYNVQNKNTGEWNSKDFNYTPLDVILDKIKENQNFAFMQPICTDKEKERIGIKCVLIHKSGKSLISDLFPFKIREGAKIQDEGAEITYRKRYAAGAFLGIATDEDTDGPQGDIPDKKKDKKTKENTISQEPITEEQLLIIANLTPDVKERTLEIHKKKSITELTKAEADFSIKALTKKGLIKSKEEIEKESKEKEEVF